MTIIPSIDLRAGRVVRLRQGDYADQLNYDVDPIAAARRFFDEGARFLHVVDLDGAKAGRPAQVDLLRAIVQAVPGEMTVQAGGGVREAADIDAILSTGAGRVVVGTRAVNDLDWLRAQLDRPNVTGRIVLALDARDGIVATHGWTESAGIDLFDFARRVATLPLAAILYTDVSKDGLLGGPDCDGTGRLVAAAAPLPVIASGGIGSIHHIREVRKTGCAAVIVGRSLYESRLTVRDAIAAAYEPADPVDLA